MSDPLFQALVESNRRLTETVEGKIGEIDQKVDEATSSVPATIAALSSQTFYIDAVGGDDNNDGLTPNTAVQNVKVLNDKVVNGSFVMLLFFANQNHTVNFFMYNGYIRVGVYGSTPTTDSYPKLYPEIKYSGGKHLVYGLGAYLGTLYFNKVKLMCDSQGIFDVTPRDLANGFIRYTDSNLTIIGYGAHIHLVDMPFSAGYSGYSVRDFCFSSAVIDKTLCTNDGQILKNINSTENTFRLDVYSTSLVNVPGGWAELMPETTDKVNMLTNVSF